MKALLPTFLFCLWVWHSHAQNASLPAGSGTINDPYLIENLNHLYWMSSQPSSALSGKFFSQTNNIDASETNSWFPIANSPSGWIPIGLTSQNAFSGTYNGNGFIISNLFINNTGQSNCGLFGYLNNASVKNLHLKNVSLLCNSYIGAIAGNSNSSLIENCSSDGIITSVSGYAGGLCGKSSYNSTISLCRSDCNVNGISNCGGLVGEISGASLSNCYARGNVTRNSGTIGTFGGAIGYALNSLIQYCYSTGPVVYSGSVNPTAKGFVGNSSGSTYTSVFFDMNTSGQSSSTGGTGLSTLQMKSYEQFQSANFDLKAENIVGSEDYWALSASTNDGYPNLEKVQQLNFTGLGSTNWAESSNWSPQMIPDSLSDLIIPSTKSVEVPAGYIARCRTLMMESQSLLSMLASSQAQSELICEGAITNAGVIKQEAVIQGGWINPGSNWHLISSLAGKTPITTLIPNSGDYDLYAWDENSATWINSKALNNPVPFDDSLKIGKGYLVSYSEYQIIEFTGTPYQGEFSSPEISNSSGTYGGWNLLGNPYSYSVNWKGSKLSPPNTGNIAKIWSSTNEAYFDLLPGETIKKGTGFFVYANESSRHAETSHSDPEEIFSLHLADENRFLELQYLIHSDAGFCEDDSWDSRYMQANGRQFYWYSNQNAYSLLAHPAIAESSTIQIAVESEEKKNYRLELILNNRDIVLCLFDNKTKKYHQLNEAPYHFIADPADDPIRFEVTLCLKKESEGSSGCCEIENQRPDIDALLFPVFGEIITYPSGWNESNTQLYDLAGRKISSPENGVYIVRKVH